jgi:hypothetical protein
VSVPRSHDKRELSGFPALPGLPLALYAITDTAGLRAKLERPGRVAIPIDELGGASETTGSELTTTASASSSKCMRWRVVAHIYVDSWVQNGGSFSQALKFDKRP